MRFLFEITVIDDGDGNPVHESHRFTGMMSIRSDDINSRMDELIYLVAGKGLLTRWNKRVNEMPMLCRSWIGRLPPDFCASKAEAHSKGVGYFICSDDAYSKWCLASYELPSRIDDAPNIYRDSLRDVVWNAGTLDVSTFRWATNQTLGYNNVNTTVGIPGGRYQAVNQYPGIEPPANLPGQ